MNVESVYKISDINNLLNVWSEGDKSVENILIELLYPEIHLIAHHQVKSRSSNSLQTTEIVSEAFIKLSKQQSVNWQNKSHFLAIASKVIRRILIDHYRKETRLKRGDNLKHITVDRVKEFIEDPSQENLNWLELSDLIDTLSEIDKEAAMVAEYKIFGGLSILEIAEVISKSKATVSRIWKFARSWLILQYK